MLSKNVVVLARALLIFVILASAGFARGIRAEDQPNLGDVASTPSETANLKNITQVNQDGFGQRHNKYSWSSAIFKGQLYIGTLSAYNRASLWVFMISKPFRTDGAQIWRANPSLPTGHWQWDQVVENGLSSKDNFGVRKMIVVADYLYAVTANYTDGFELWRTHDGDTWTVEIPFGNGNKNNESGRGLAAIGNYLYVGVSNAKDGGSILRREIDPETGDWAENSAWSTVYEAGTGGDYWYSDIIEYDGYIYTGALDLKKGGSILRSNGYTNSMGQLEFERVWSSPLVPDGTTAVMKLYVYPQDGDDQHLYAGTQNFIKGAWLLRSSDGINWDTVFTGGDGSRHNQYVWYLKEFAGRLYFSTYNNDVGFWLMSSDDGTNFVAENQDGLGDSSQIGIRTMEVLSRRPERDLLILGTAASGSNTKVYTAEAED